MREVSTSYRLAFLPITAHLQTLEPRAEPRLQKANWSGNLGMGWRQRTTTVEAHKRQRTTTYLQTLRCRIYVPLRSARGGSNTLHFLNVPPSRTTTHRQIGRIAAPRDESVPSERQP